LVISAKQTGGQADIAILNLFEICDLSFARPNGFIRAGNLLTPVRFPPGAHLELPTGASLAAGSSRLGIPQFLNS
jgi:hypothetical protein